MADWSADLAALKELLLSLRQADLQNAADKFTGQREAVLKAEAASEKRFDGVNEFRATLADQQRTLMPRAESELRMNAQDRQIDDMMVRLAAIQSRSRGFAGGWGVAVGVIGLIGAVVAIVLNLRRP